MMDMPAPSFPRIPVAFHYFEAGELRKSLHAVCAAVPRVGDFVWPERGTAAVV